MKQTMVLLALMVLVLQQATTPTKWRRPDNSINWEAEKIATDTIVIHHTGEAPGMTWAQLSEIQKSTLYVPRYASKNNDPYVFGETPHSGHFRREGGQDVEVFYAYHWLVRTDGSTERLLKDEEVGWHAGDWETNCRSIAICLDGDFSTAKPSAKALQAVAKLVAGYQKKFQITRVVGHNEVRVTTKCPGLWFSEGGRELILGRK